ncbi:MAG: hypothetical protein ACPGGK_12000 [Pikeienuella sp.]
MATVTTIFGVIKGDGTIVSGSGYSVTNASTGVYEVAFDTAFQNIPAVVATQCGYGNGENALDNVIIPKIAAANFTAITGDSCGNHVDREFSFIATGI